ncbi:MAG: sirohydrochlorin chelatase [Timaviella obliquedivisa GSE-PSE-MK23-08B]|jgi:sirohydrochlorin ferrochelatase|nr:sirohydrochlorin chelatase [Timaviella obliquedivisa GSE-PSE-MK23-08B]
MLPKTSSTYLLVSHGSRDPRPQIATAQLAELVAQQLKTVGELQPLVKTAVLDCAPTPLHQQIQVFAQEARALRELQGLDPTHLRISVIPLFLIPGVHVVEDIPAEVAIAQQFLGDSIVLKICPYLGTDTTLYELLTPATQSAAKTGCVLMSHGSRRAGGNSPVEAIATHLKALPAYWSVTPSLETQVSNLVAQGCEEIDILPYFLFEGGITDAIAQTVAQLNQKFPATHLKMTETLGANPVLATHIVNLISYNF